MDEFGKIFSGDSEVTCNITNYTDFVSLVQDFGQPCPDGYLRVVKDADKPTPATGEVLWFRYEVSDGVLKKHYFCKALPRKLSKLKIYAAVSSLPAIDGVPAWSVLQSWLEGKTINGMNGWLAFQLAQELSEEHPMFEALSEEARGVLHLTSEQFNCMLAQCVLDD